MTDQNNTETGQEAANTNFLKAQSICHLIANGFTPASTVTAVNSGDLSLLQHAGTAS